MPLYSTSNLQAGSQQSLTATAATQVSITAATGAATLVRAHIYEVEVGADGAPNATDCAIIYDWVRQSTLGTGSTATPSPLDLADAAAGPISTVNYTVEPSTGVLLMAIALNQRNSQRWIAKEGSELIVPATNVAGIAGRARSPTYASTVVVTEFFST